MRLLLLLLPLIACRDRTPPPCAGVNEAVVSTCHLQAPMDCDTANDEFIRCVDQALTGATSCTLMRQKISRCVVKHGN